MAAPPTDPRSRQLGDERARYGRKSLRERLGDIAGWARAHPIPTAVGIAFVLFGVFLSSTGSVVPGDLRIGDCLFVRTSATQGTVRPIGEPAVVAAVLFAGGAERAGCSASHGHEVSAILALTQALTPTEVSAACAAAFEPYLGRPLSGSRYVTFAALPVPSSPIDGANVGICLIARSDGQWMDHSAHGSGE